MPKKHKLGLGNGRIVEYEDGTAAYYSPASLTQSFRVPIADVTGFSVTKGSKALERTVNVIGSGTLLASVSVPHGTPQRIERWFCAHPQFGSRATPVVHNSDETPSPSPNTRSVADELRKLAELRTEGVLTDDEFAAQKARLLSGD